MTGQRLVPLYRLDNDGRLDHDIEYVCVEAACGDDDNLKKKLLKRITDSKEKRAQRVEAQHAALPTLLGQPYPHVQAVAHLVPLQFFKQLISDTTLYGVLYFSSKPTRVSLTTGPEIEPSATRASSGIDNSGAKVDVPTAADANTCVNQKHGQHQQQQQQQQHPRSETLTGMKRTKSDRLVSHADAGSSTEPRQQRFFVVLDLDHTLIECRPVAGCPPGSRTIDLGAAAGCAGMVAYVRPGVPRFLNKLAEAGYAVNVLSAGTDDYVQNIVQGLNRIVTELHGGGPVIGRFASCRDAAAKVQQKCLTMVGISGTDTHRSLIVDDTKIAWQRRWRSQVLPIVEPTVCGGQAVDDGVFERLVSHVFEVHHYVAKGIRAGDVVEAMLERDCKRLQGLTAAFGAMLRHEALPLHLPSIAPLPCAPPLKAEPEHPESLAVKVEPKSDHEQAL